METTTTDPDRGSRAMTCATPRGTVGCIGLCQVCGKAILLMATYVNGFAFWAHFGVGPGHYGEPKPGIHDVIRASRGVT